jgi:peptidoglycan biosynthesis protein MviN/MurJ (putative lipid II flippase)
MPERPHGSPAALPAPGPTVTAGVPPALVPTEANTARSSLAVSAGFLLTSLLSGALAILVAIVVGEGPDTDAYFAAYSIYLFFVIFGAGLRVSVVPLLGAVADEETWRASAADVLARLVGAALAVTAVVVVLSPVLGPLLTPGLPAHARAIAAVCLAILALASYAQIAGAALASALAAVRRFPASSAIYVLGAGGSLVLGTVFMALFGIVGAAVGVLGGSATILLGHVAYLRRFGFRVAPAVRALRDRRTWHLAALASAGTALAFAQQMQLTVALAFVSSTVGAVTAYTYGAFIAALLASATIYVVGFVMLPGVLAALSAAGERAALDYLVGTVPVAFYLYVPIAVAYATFGRPVVDAVLGGSLSAQSLDLVWDTSRIFLLMNLALAIQVPAGAIVLALRRYRALVIAAVAGLVVHVVGVAVVSGSGPVAVAVVHAAVGAAMLVPILALGFGGYVWREAGRCIVRSLPVAPLALIFPALTLVLPAASGLAGAVGLSALGMLLYVAIGYVAWPAVGGRTVGMLLARGG